VLTVRRAGEDLAMDFPSRPPARCETPAALSAALGRAPRETWQSRDFMAVYDTEDEVRALAPDMNALRALGGFGNIATAPGRDGVDFVSRFFAPAVGVPEDPATGSSHCTLTPYWARRLGKSKLVARQISKRVGDLRCEDLGERVSIAGRAAVYLEGTIEV
jgi:predicted PhzF superfamily epimerase YddE/YHI9